MDKELEQIFATARQAQKIYSTFSQEKVDEIFRNVAKAANQNRILLAKCAIEETGKGILEDKVIKNHFASEFIYNKYKDLKTVGTISVDKAAGIEVIAEPVGIVGAITPVTNPTSTAIFKILLALKTRNGIVISPHPQAKNCVTKTVEILSKAATEAGAPENLIQSVANPTLEMTNDVMVESDIILATGGGGLVKAAYSSGTPAIGVGAGNCPAIIAADSNLEMAVTSIIQSNVFDNGMICATENSVIVEEAVYDKVVALFTDAYGHIVKLPAEIDKFRDKMFKQGKYGLLNPELVGQKATKVAELVGIKVPSSTKLILVEAKKTSYDEPLAHEKLSTYVALYKCQNIEDGVEKARELLTMGPGHTASIFTNENNQENINRFKTLNAGRLLVNQPSSVGGVGDIFNFALEPSMTLGCGTWGGNVFSGNVGPKLLINEKRLVMRRENTLWIKVPRTYFKENCTPEALKDLKEMKIKKAFVVSDKIIWDFYGKKLSKYLEDLDILYEVFTNVEPNPTLSSVNKGLDVLRPFAPDVIIGFGGGSSIDAAKLMWFNYENPGVAFNDLAMTFADIRKRIVKFPTTGEKVKFVAIPTTAGTGSEVTPFSVITDEKTHMKYPLADYALLPTLAIVDAQFQMTMPKSVTAVSGMDALSHCFEAYASVLANEFTDPYALKGIEMIFENLSKAYSEGEKNKEARINMAHAATIAGIAFANAFLGIVHSMSHKLGAYFNVIHGQANALFLPYVIKYNSMDKEGKVQMFAQHKTANTKARYVEIARMLKLKGKTDDELLNALIDKCYEQTKAIGLKTSIKELGVDRDAFYKAVDKMAEDSFDDQCTGANPRYPLIEDIKNIFIAVYEGTDPKTLKI